MSEDNSPKIDDEPVPKLPRGRTFRFAGGQIMSIGLLLIALFAVVAMRGACAAGAGSMLEAFDEPPQDPAIVPTAPTIDPAPSLTPVADAGRRD